MSHGGGHFPGSAGGRSFWFNLKLTHPVLNQSGQTRPAIIRYMPALFVVF